MHDKYRGSIAVAVGQQETSLLVLVIHLKNERLGPKPWQGSGLNQIIGHLHVNTLSDFPT